MHNPAIYCLFDRKKTVQIALIFQMGNSENQPKGKKNICPAIIGMDFFFIVPLVQNTSF
jgi:hypothetical protein